MRSEDGRPERANLAHLFSGREKQHEIDRRAVSWMPVRFPRPPYGGRTLDRDYLGGIILPLKAVLAPMAMHRLTPGFRGLKKGATRVCWRRALPRHGSGKLASRWLGRSY